MKWNLLYGQSTPPTLESISQYVSNELWDKLNLTEALIQWMFHAARLEFKISKKR